MLYRTTVGLFRALTAGLIACQFGSAAAQTPPEGFEIVTVEVGGGRPVSLKGYLRRPTATESVPAIVALHGCGGLFTAKGRLQAREADWAERLANAGYAVLFLDSFNSRGYRQICTLTAGERPIRPQHRAEDAHQALFWLARQPFVDAKRLALLGWSHGGSSVLWTTTRGKHLLPMGEIRAAVAFYPGCRPLAEQADFQPGVPLTILIGSADDWTPPGPCRVLAGRAGVKLIEYPGAVHGFDAPNSPRRTRTDVGQSARGDGRVEVGTDPVARAAAIEAVAEILAVALRDSRPR